MDYIQQVKHSKIFVSHTFNTREDFTTKPVPEVMSTSLTKRLGSENGGSLTSFYNMKAFLVPIKSQVWYQRYPTRTT